MPIKPLGERIKHLQKRKRKGKLGDKGGARLDKLKTKQYGKRHDQDAALPYDAQYTSDTAGINRDYNFGSAQLAQQGGLLNYETGIGDASNPYSRAALLQKSYETNQRGSTNSYAASGQLYSGALQNARNANVADLHQGQHALGLDYLKAQAGLTGAQTQLGYSRDDAMQAAMAANVARAAAEPVTDAPPKPGFVKRHTKSLKQDVKKATKKKQQFVKSRRGGKHGATYQKKLARLKQKNRAAKKKLKNVPNEYADRPEV
ncbi:MAG: hypothetical protein ACYSUN_11220 [Planctomycetota bacterium]|jgi:cell division protein FtsB